MIVRHRSTAAGIAALLALACGGCAFQALKKDVTRLEGMSLIGGRVSRPTDDGSPIVVCLIDARSSAQLDSFVLSQPGAWFFMVPPGTYRLAAFVDRNDDAKYEREVEPAVAYGAPTDVPVGPGQKVGNLDLAITTASSAPLDMALVAFEQGRRPTRELPPIHVGEVTTIDDPRFTAENGHLGLWEPVEFLFRVGAGFYFLEPYDPNKTPVLFVHGAGGYPSQFRQLIAGLDRKKFQPWLLFYPSGMDVMTIARGAARWLDVLEARHHFDRIVVVAHSMGGLVSRALINTMVTQGDGKRLAGFITMSTPWNGQADAALGVEQSPVVMPMWRDMAPGSEFLKNLFTVPLPEKCPHSLLFSYVGHSLVLDVPNDGVVAISSELALPVQRAAHRVYGFSESHTGILRSAEVSQTVNASLAEAIH